MISPRRQAIINIIKNGDIPNQVRLSEKLSELGFAVTQATVSRDIKFLRLVKEMNAEGQSCYRLPNGQGQADGFSDGRLSTVFKNSCVNVDFAMNNIVIKTLPGMAGAAASGLDAMRFSGVLGSVAGDDTVLIITRDEKSAYELCKKLANLIKTAG